MEFFSTYLAKLQLKPQRVCQHTDNMKQWVKGEQEQNCRNCSYISKIQKKIYILSCHRTDLSLLPANFYTVMIIMAPGAIFVLLYTEQYS